jgi:hypothetical protein
LPTILHQNGAARKNKSSVFGSPAATAERPDIAPFVPRESIAHHKQKAIDSDPVIDYSIVALAFERISRLS